MGVFLCWAQHPLNAYLVTAHPISIRSMNACISQPKNTNKQLHHTNVTQYLGVAVGRQWIFSLCSPIQSSGFLYIFIVYIIQVFPTVWRLFILVGFHSTTRERLHQWRTFNIAAKIASHRNNAHSHRYRLIIHRWSTFSMTIDKLTETLLKMRKLIQKKVSKNVINRWSDMSAIECLRAGYWAEKKFEVNKPI